LASEIAKLRNALGDDSKTPKYLQTVRTRGYRFIAEVQRWIRVAMNTWPECGRVSAAGGRKVVENASGGHGSDRRFRSGGLIDLNFTKRQAQRRVMRIFN